MTSTTTALRAVVYLRQSMDREGDRYAVSRQLEDGLKLCAARGITSPRVIEDNDTSATSRRKRKGYEELLGLVRAGLVDVIVAYAVDRLVRRLADLEALIDLIEQHRVTVMTVAGELDLSTPAGRLNARILASVARAEVETKVARQKRSSLQRAADGRPHSGGPRTVGYDHGMTAVRAHEAALIQEGFSQLLAGASLNSIIRHWNNAGLRTARGTAWSPRSAKIALTNPRYAGLSAYQVRNGGKGEVMGQGQWAPIVTPEVYGAAQTILSDPARSTTTDRSRRYLLGGLAICGVCAGGADLIRSGGMHSKGYHLYRCATRPGHLQRKSAPIDEYVRQVIAERLRLPGAGVTVDSAPGVDQQALKDEAAAIRVRQEEAGDSFADGLITRAQLERITGRLSERLEAIAAAQAAATGGNVLAPLLAQLDPGAAFLAADLDIQRAVIQHLCSVTIMGAGLGAKGFNPDSVVIDWR